MDKLSLLRLCHHVENEYLAFRSQLKKLEVLEYPTTACLDLISKVDKISLEKLNNIREIIKGLHSIKVTSDLEDIKDEIKLSRRKLFEILTIFLGRIYGAQTQRVPWSLIPSIESLANVVIPDYISILFSENLDIYETRWYLRLPEEFQDLKKYNFITLPRLHRLNILMHTLVGHDPQSDKFINSHKNDIASHITTKIESLPSNERPDIVYDELTVVCSRAIEELLCDMACGELFGPAMFFAMRTYASFSEFLSLPSSGNNYYPSWQYRFEFVWKYAVDQKDLKKLWEEVDKHIDGSVKQIGNIFKKESKKVFGSYESSIGHDHIMRSKYKIAYEEVERWIADMQKFIKSSIPATVPRWNDKKVIEQIPEMINRLNHGIPPNEIIHIDRQGKKPKYNLNPHIYQQY